MSPNPPPNFFAESVVELILSEAFCKAESIPEPASLADSEADSKPLASFEPTPEDLDINSFIFLMASVIYSSIFICLEYWPFIFSIFSEASSKSLLSCI